MTPIQLDLSKLFGFKIVVNEIGLKAQQVVIGAKLGGKPGTKPGKMLSEFFVQKA
jgi:hypothetical protein